MCADLHDDPSIKIGLIDEWFMHHRWSYMGILKKIVFEYYRQTIIFDTVIDKTTYSKE